MNVAPPVMAVLHKEITYSGSKEECYEAWLAKITQVAITQGWNGDDKRRAEIGSLKEAALEARNLRIRTS